MKHTTFAAGAVAAVFLGSPCASAEERLRVIMGDDIVVLTSEYGEPSCYLNNLEDLISTAKQHLQSDCGFNVIDDPALTTSRMYISLAWGRSELVGSNVQVNICYAGVQIQIGQRVTADVFGAGQHDFPDNEVVITQLYNYISGVSHQDQQGSRSVVRASINEQLEAIPGIFCK